MGKRFTAVQGLIVALLVLNMIISGCSGPAAVTGRVSGVVTDDERYLPQGVAAQTYEGASISIYAAVEAGSYKISEGAPESKNYSVGDSVRQLTAGKGGAWEVELPAGRYFIRAFAGQKSYSGDILIEVQKGAALKLDLKLKSGI